MAETVGELKKILAEQGNPWTVDPRLNDEEALPDPPRGGQDDEQIPKADRLVPLDKDVDVRKLLAKEPPSNPWLALQWVEQGILDRSEVEGVAPMGGEKEFGAS